jgi:hypothetical protein
LKAKIETEFDGYQEGGSSGENDDDEEPED